METVTYQRDGERWLTSNRRLFNTEEQAASYCQAMNDYRAMMAQIPQSPWDLSRSEYEAACALVGVEALSDADCTSYGVRHGEFSVSEYAVAVCVQMALSSRRGRAVEAEQAARPKTQPREVGMVLCDCGHRVPRGQRMVASLGTCCPDCYDRMSA